MNDRQAKNNMHPIFRSGGTKNIVGTNLLTKFHDDRTINVASRVLTRKNSSPCGNPNQFGTTINVASRGNKLGINFLLRKRTFRFLDQHPTTRPVPLMKPHERQRRSQKAHHQHIVLR
ncbi:hypothetical protein DPMN_025471 [Dreissena polymorpha]|uniref:Uncharacterized protein n=1 Tax=Dreissena polymorpha TaxID=45954 RepID=A0A9D4LRE8_DREPO|nr:hypothetical protein DPMN_025471 [Dreissena polymorpha]